MENSVETRPTGLFLVITGPTASGKTAFSTLLSRCAKIEIINCDVGQLYAPLSIGTAKPDLKNVSIPHHLFDVVSTPESFSAAAYRKRAVAVVEDILSRGALPVFVGGSLFYVKSLFYPPQELELDRDQHKDPDKNPDFEGFDGSIESAILWEKLFEIDPARALAIDKNDRYRITRALTLWYKTGRLPSSCAPIYSPIGPRSCIVAVTHDRAVLNARIDARVIQMFDEGLVEEVKEVVSLSPPWGDFLRKKKLIGYYELLSAPRSIEVETVKETIKQNTRAYAKRQMTFLRAFLGSMRALATTRVIDADLTLCDDYLYIEQVVAWINESMPQCLKNKEGLE